MKWKKITLLIVLFFASVVYFIYFQAYDEGIQVGDLAPPFDLPMMTGENIQLYDFKGKYVLVSFWATWCPPCLHEMPSMDKLYQRYHERGLDILAIRVDEGKWPAINKFLKKTPVSFPVLLDETSRVAYAYGTYQLPETYLVGPGQTVIEKYIGPQNWVHPRFISYFDKLLSSAHY